MIDIIYTLKLIWKYQNYCKMSKQCTDGIGEPLVAYLLLRCKMITIWKALEKIFFFNYDVLRGYKINIIICMFAVTNDAAFKINFQFQIKNVKSI